MEEKSVPEADHEDLRRYFQDGSEEAFAVLVRRHIRLVYWAALRQVADPSLAEDVTQVVFTVLARKAGKISPKVCLAGWLYQTTRFTAAKAVRTETRRRQRELEAFQMQETTQPTDTDPDDGQLAVSLDQAMAQLSRQDCDLLLLRFFENKSLRDLGKTFGLSEDAAQKRVARSILKLRGLMLKRRAVVSAAAVTGVLSTQAAQMAVPAKLAAVTIETCLGRTTLSVTSRVLVRSVLKHFLWTQIAPWIIGSTVILAVTSSLFVFHPSHKAAAKSDIYFHLFGTPGVKYELVYSAAGQSHTNTGVSPADVPIYADGFTTFLNIEGPGKLDYELYRQGRLMGKASITSTNTMMLTMLPQGRGIFVSSRKKPQ